MDPLSAIAEPRLRDQDIPHTNHIRVRYKKGTVAYLASLGHDISYVASIAQGVREKGRVFQAETGPRRIDSGGTLVQLL